MSVLHVAGHDRLVEVLRRGPILTDDSLRLEFSTPRHMSSPQLDDTLVWIAERLWSDAPSPYAELLRAQACQAAGDWETMRRHLRRAIFLHPDHGYVNRFAGEFSLFMADIRTRAARVPGIDPEEKTRAIEMAEHWLVGARGHLGDDPRIDGAEADLLVVKGEKEKAVAMYRKLLEATPDSVYLARKIARLE